MVLDVNSIFGRSNINSKETRSATIIVAKDGSGDTDDIKEAVKMLDGAGGSIFIKDGVYEINSQIDLTPSLMIFGTGAATILLAVGDHPIFRVINDNVYIADMQLSGTNAGASQYGILVYTCNNCKIRRCIIKNFGNIGVYLNGTTYSTITECEIYNNNNYGILLERVVLVKTWYSIISNNVIRENGNGIWLMGNAAALTEVNIIANNQIRTNTTNGLRYDVNADTNLAHGNIFVSNGTNISDAGAGNISADNILI